MHAAQSSPFVVRVYQSIEQDVGGNLIMVLRRGKTNRGEKA